MKQPLLSNCAANSWLFLLQISTQIRYSTISGSTLMLIILSFYQNHSCGSSLNCRRSIKWLLDSGNLKSEHLFSHFVNFHGAHNCNTFWRNILRRVSIVQLPSLHLCKKLCSMGQLFLLWSRIAVQVLLRIQLCALKCYCSSHRSPLLKVRCYRVCTIL